MQHNYYKLLGLEHTATQADIKKAYRSLAMQYHPDRNPQDESSEERFKLITEAYEVLKDSRKRAEYDRLAAIAAAKNEFNKRPSHDDLLVPDDEVLGEFLRGFYYRQDASKKKGRKGNDIRCNLRITFEEAALGVEKSIRIPCTINCPQCAGTGVKAGSKIMRCRECRGNGKAKTKKGFYATCTVCQGKGTIITAQCKRCSGSGEVQSRRSINVNVPPGIETGARLNVSGMGLPGKNEGKPGDLYVVVQVKKHPFFDKHDSDIVCTVPIPFVTAVLGCTLEVPTLNGKKKIKIPPGVQTGQRFVLSGFGVSAKNKKKRGDLIIILKVEMPKKLTRDEKKVLRTLSDTIRSDAYPLTKAFNSKLEKY